MYHDEPIHTPRHAPSEEMVRNLIRAARGEFRLLVSVAAETGIRGGEIVNLRWRDVDLEALTVTSNGKASGHTKPALQVHQMLCKWAGALVANVQGRPQHLNQSALDHLGLLGFDDAEVAVQRNRPFRAQNPREVPCRPRP